MDIEETLTGFQWEMTFTKNKPFSMLRTPSLEFSKDLLNDPRTKCSIKMSQIRTFSLLQ